MKWFFTCESNQFSEICFIELNSFINNNAAQKSGNAKYINK